MGTVVNITVNNDADFYCVFQYQTVAGDPIDITGVSMTMMLRRHAADEAAQLRLGTDTGEIVIVDGPGGQFTVRIAQETLERLGLGDYDHSNVMVSGGLKRNIWTGKFTNNAGAARSHYEGAIAS
jgi:hypothetical protein